MPSQAGDHADPVPDLLGRLRQNTRAAHDRLEALPRLAALVSPALTLPGYIDALLALHAFHASVQDRLPALLSPLRVRHADAVMFLDQAGACAALERDLRMLGAEPSAPVCAMAALPDTPSALGVLYVIEGSALGGRVIARNVADTLSLARESGASFFNRFDAETLRRRWRALVELLRAAPPSWHAACLASAGAAFAEMERHGRTEQRRPDL